MGRGAHSNGQPKISQTDHDGDPQEPRPAWKGRQGEEWTDCVADDLRLFGIGDGEGWKTVVLDPGKWWEVVMEGGRTLMATWRTEERAAEIRRNKREAEEADKTPIVPGVTAGQLRRFRAALIGPLLPPSPAAP